MIRRPPRSTLFPSATLFRSVFSVQPSTTAAGAVITPAGQGTAQDAQGNTATEFTGNVTGAIGANPSTGTLAGTKGVPAVGGGGAVLRAGNHQGDRRGPRLKPSPSQNSNP